MFQTVPKSIAEHVPFSESVILPLSVDVSEYLVVGTHDSSLKEGLREELFYPIPVLVVNRRIYQ